MIKEGEKTEGRVNKVSWLTKKILSSYNNRVDSDDMPEDVKKELKEIMAGMTNAAGKGNVDLVKKYSKRMVALKNKLKPK